MGLEQLYYTSTRMGVDGTSGAANFRFYAASQGCTQRMFHELTTGQHVLYFPLDPKTLLDAPVAFSYYRFGSEDKFIGQVQVTGMTDASNRKVPFGHFIISADGKPGFANEYPAQFWKSPDFWNQKLRSTEELPPSTTLPPLDTVTPGPLTMEEVTRFITSENRLDRCVELLTCVEDYFAPSTELRRRIMISDLADNVAKWIYAMGRAFPLRLAERISFTTYNFDPDKYCDHVISGITAERALSFSDVVSRQKYRVFDFSNNSFSVGDKVSRYAQVVRDRTKEGNFSVIEAFCRFCDELKSDIGFGDLFGLFVLYGLREGFFVREGFSLKRDGLAVGLEAVKKLPQEPADKMRPILEAAMRSVGEVDQLPLPMSRDLLRWANGPGVSLEIRDIVAGAFLDLFLAKILPSATSETVSDVARELLQTTLNDLFWENAGKKVSEQIQMATDPALAARLIDFTNAMGRLPVDEEIKYGLMMDTLLPSLAESAEAQRCVSVLMENDKTGRFLVALLDHLQGKIEQEAYMTSVAPFLSRSEATILDPLIRAARERRSSRLCMFLHGLSGQSRDNRVRSLRRAHSDLEDIYLNYDDNAGMLRDLKELISSLWTRTSGMSEADWTEFWDLLSSDPFYLRFLHDDLGLAELVREKIMAREDLVSFDSKEETLARRLKRILSRDERLRRSRRYAGLCSLFTILGTIDTWERLCLGKALNKSNVDEYLHLLEVLPASNQKVRDRVVGYAAQMLICETPDLDSHSRSYGLLCDEVGEEFAGHYDRELGNDEHTKDLEVAHLATIFKTLQGRVKMSPGPETPVEQGILDNSFRMVYYRKEKQLKEFMFGDPDFENWLARIPQPKKGLFGIWRHKGT